MLVVQAQWELVTVQARTKAAQGANERARDGIEYGGKRGEESNRSSRQKEQNTDRIGT